jgi:ABC-type multidrug transport system ATPase subunit
VRLGRASLRPGVRLALLDEPFRGLDRDTRRRLLAASRRRWRDATLVCAIHDLEETLEFDRVVVLEGGRVAADGRPRELLRDPRSAYTVLLQAERALFRELWGSPAWTRWRVEDGRLDVTGGGGPIRLRDEGGGGA